MPASTDVVEEEEAAKDQEPSAPQARPRHPISVPLKGDGGSVPRRTRDQEKEQGRDTDTLASDRLSVMSFAFNNTDQIKPVPRQSRPAIPPPNNTAARAVSAASQRRTSGGHLVGNAADAKFAHRLRTDGNAGDATLRPASRIRRSLPPAMGVPGARAASGAGAAGHTSLGPSSTYRAVNVDVNASTAVHGRMSPAVSMRSTTKQLTGLPKSPRKGRPASITAPTTTTTAGVRGVRGVAGNPPPPVTGTRKVVPKTSAGPSNPPLSGVVANAQKKTLRPSPSSDSAVAGMWSSYYEGGVAGTPRKPPPVGRQLGGRI